MTEVPRSRKPKFAPGPVRAIGDRRLTETHLRVILAIALHDRLSQHRKNGQGCWASHRKLAELCNINYTNLSTAIRELGELGYLSAQPHHLNKRRRVYRVIYDDSLPEGEQSESTNSLSVDKQSTVDGRNNSLIESRKAAEIVCPPKSDCEPNQSLTDVEYIPLNGEDITQKRGRHSSEEASLREVARNEGAALAQIERSHIRSSQPLSPEELSTIGDIMSAHDHGDPLYHWAERILELYEEQGEQP